MKKITKTESVTICVSNDEKECSEACLYLSYCDLHHCHKFGVKNGRQRHLDCIKEFGRGAA